MARHLVCLFAEWRSVGNRKRDCESERGSLESREGICPQPLLSTRGRGSSAVSGHEYRRRSVAGGQRGHDGRPSRASVGRLSLYLRRLELFLHQGTTTVSSSELGEPLGVTDAQVRKDLAHLGHLGQPGIGYPVRESIGAIRRVLGIDRDWSVALVGVGNLARALLRYRGFQERGFRIVALFDTDPGKIGSLVDGLTVLPPEDMNTVIRATRAELGVVAVPSQGAQAVTDALVAAGVQGILNFAPIVLRLPSGIASVSVDLTVQLEHLAFLVQDSTSS